MGHVEGIVGAWLRNSGILEFLPSTASLLRLLSLVRARPILPFISVLCLVVVTPSEPSAGSQCLLCFKLFRIVPLLLREQLALLELGIGETIQVVAVFGATLDVPQVHPSASWLRRRSAQRFQFKARPTRLAQMRGPLLSLLFLLQLLVLEAQIADVPVRRRQRGHRRHRRPALKRRGLEYRAAFQTALLRILRDLQLINLQVSIILILLCLARTAPASLLADASQPRHVVEPIDAELAELAQQILRGIRQVALRLLLSLLALNLFEETLVIFEIVECSILEVFRIQIIEEVGELRELAELAHLIVVFVVVAELRLLQDVEGGALLAHLALLEPVAGGGPVRALLQI